MLTDVVKRGIMMQIMNNIGVPCHEPEYNSAWSINNRPGAMTIVVLKSDEVRL
jgi:hypothetical protein